jgi:hypothetical protein
MSPELLRTRAWLSGPSSIVADVTSELREASARAYEQAADELETAARHCRTAAQHLRDGEIPRATAHAWAAFGHVRQADGTSAVTPVDHSAYRSAQASYQLDMATPIYAEARRRPAGPASANVP